MTVRESWLLLRVFVALIVDGMDLQMLALSLPSISKELRISGVSAGALSTYTLLGMGIGGVLAGWLSDRIGRVRVVWWSALTFSTFTGVIALCHTYLQIAVMRFISGFGLGALYKHRDAASGRVRPHPSEDYCSRHAAGRLVGGVRMRGAALRVSTAASMVGEHSLACAIIPGIVTLVLLWKVPDPPSWAATQRGLHANR